LKLHGVHVDGGLDLRIWLPLHFHWVVGIVKYREGVGGQGCVCGDVGEGIVWTSFGRI